MRHSKLINPIFNIDNRCKCFHMVSQAMSRGCFFLFSPPSTTEVLAARDLRFFLKFSFTKRGTTNVPKTFIQKFRALKTTKVRKETSKELSSRYIQLVNHQNWHLLSISNFKNYYFMFKLGMLFRIMWPKLCKFVFLFQARVTNSSRLTSELTISEVVLMSGLQSSAILGTKNSYVLRFFCDT